VPADVVAEGRLPEVERPVVLAGRGLTRRYVTPSGTVVAVEGVDVDVRSGALTAIVGSSGSGKSTVLRLLACLDRPDEGEVRLDGAPIHDLAPRWRRELRRRRIAYLESEPVHNLLDGMDAGANVRAAARWRGGPHVAVNPGQALADVGLDGREGAHVTDLSGGEQQRLALAVATAGFPSVVVADEPTASLDRSTVGGVVHALARQAARGAAIVVATHDPVLVNAATYIVRLELGRMVEP
jgi:putative ABC transport system ATP-binding protein